MEERIRFYPKGFWRKTLIFSVLAGLLTYVFLRLLRANGVDDIGFAFFSHGFLVGAAAALAASGLTLLHPSLRFGDEGKQ